MSLSKYQTFKFYQLTFSPTPGMRLVPGHQVYRYFDVHGHCFALHDAMRRTALSPGRLYDARLYGLVGPEEVLMYLTDILTGVTVHCLLVHQTEIYDESLERHVREFVDSWAYDEVRYLGEDWLTPYEACKIELESKLFEWENSARELGYSDVSSH